MENFKKTLHIGAFILVMIPIAIFLYWAVIRHIIGAVINAPIIQSIISLIVSLA